MLLININIFAFDAQKFTDKISDSIAIDLYNVEPETAQKYLSLIVEENEKNIVALKLIDTIDDSIIYEYYKNQVEFLNLQKKPQKLKKYKLLKKTIAYKDEKVGQLVLYFKDTNSIKLTDQEKEWIDKHPIINIGAEIDWAPYSFVDNNGKYSGISRDYINLISKISGLKFKYHIDRTWNELLVALKNGEIDVIPALYKTKEREVYTNYTNSYIQLEEYFFTNSKHKKIYSVKELEGKTIAAIKGCATVSWIREKYPKINIIEKKDMIECLEALKSGESEAYIDTDAALYTIQKNFMTDIVLNNKVKERKVVKLYIGVRKSFTILTSIINKALKIISKDEQNKILSNWVHLITSQGIILSKAEQKWLEKKEPVYFSYDPSWKPFEWRDDLGEYRGVISDLIKLVNHKSGIEFIPLESDSWMEAVEKVKSNKAIMFSGVGENSERSKYINYSSRPLLSAPYVFVSKDQTPYLNGFEDAKGKKIAVVLEYYIDGLLKKQRPDVKLTRVNSIEEGFEKLENGDIDIFILNAITAKYYKSILKHNSIYITYKTPYTLELKIGIRKDAPKEILQIINKSINLISQKDLGDIVDKWVKIPSSWQDYWLEILELLSVVVLILLFILWNNRKLQHLVEDKTIELSSLLNDFDNNVIASKTDLDGKITYVSEAFCKVSQYSSQELIGKTHHVVRHPDTPIEIFQDLWKTIQSGKTWKGTIKNLKKNGGFYWVDATIIPELDAKGKITGYSAVRQDITAQKEVEDLTSNLELKIKERTKELNEERNFIGSIISSSQDALIVINKFSIVTTWNDSATKIFGYTKEEMIANNIEKIIPYEFRELHKIGVQRVSSNGEHNLLGKGAIEIEALHKDGTTIPIDLALNTFTIDGEMFFSANIRDISDRKELADKLEKEKQFIQTLLDSQEQLIITTDGKKLLTVNETFLNFFHVDTIEDFTSSYQSNCICDTFNTKAPKGYLQIKMGDESWVDYISSHSKNTTHKVMITQNGEDFIFSVSAANLPGDEKISSAVFTDVTEIENQKKQIENILENILLPVLITSIKTRTIVYANSFAAQQYEISIEELIGKSIDIFYTYDEQKDEIIQELLTKGLVSKLGQRYKTYKGNEFDGLLSLRAIEYNGEDAYIGMVADITEQKEREKELEEIHKHTRESIEYASLIQSALIPNNNLFRNQFQDYFAIWHPKDTVGGDIYLFEELRDKDESILMVIDCTGHGVPGAFVTMLVKAIERQIVAKINNSDEVVSPGKILGIFNNSMKHLLKQKDANSISNAGFDGAIIYYNKKENILKFAGAETPLFIVEDGELKVIKGDRYSVGYKKCSMDHEYKEHIIKTKKNMQFYVTTDGYLDQNGGEKGFPFGKKRFQNIIKEYHQETLADQQEIFLMELDNYQADEEVNDDVTLIGLKI